MEVTGDALVRYDGRADPGLLQNAQAVQLAGRLDDPRQHQLPEHLVTPATARQQTERRLRAVSRAGKLVAGSAKTASAPGRLWVPHIMTAKRRRVPSAV